MINVYDMTVADYVGELAFVPEGRKFSSKRSELVPGGQSEEFWFNVGSIVSFGFIEARCPESQHEEFCETLNWLTPIREYFPASGDRGFYIDNSKRHWSLNLRVGSAGTVYDTRLCLFLISLGFRIGRFHDYKTILSRVPNKYKKVFKEGFTGANNAVGSI